jgi:hypothetical protein
MFSIFLH